MRAVATGTLMRGGAPLLTTEWDLQSGARGWRAIAYVPSHDVVGVEFGEYELRIEAEERTNRVQLRGSRTVGGRVELRLLGRDEAPATISRRPAYRRRAWA